VDIKILVATHKKYDMPSEEMYLPIQVGREGREDLGYQGDNTGDNISYKNENYSELTGLYWAWKNVNCDYIGLCHYRRYFATTSIFGIINNQNSKLNQILKKQDVEKILQNYDAILPKKRNYYIETIWSHYKHAHEIKDLEETKKILQEFYPEYIESFNWLMGRTEAYLYNMFVMKKSDFDRYSEWLFNILFELEKRIDISNYDGYQKRVFGFISERLFNIWLHYEKLSIKEVDVINMDKINWPSKIAKFIQRKVSY
jgi:hypothetical protein